MSFYSTMDAPVLQDIANCTLPNISWVIPDLAWSDHPFSNVTGAALGPSWVADIVNAIGQSYSNNANCDYWGTSGAGGSVVQPTAIFIVWDDWGGFYDHIQPPNVWTGSRSGNSWTCPAPNEWGCGYTYGFRVPFMVVSEYTGSKSGTSYTGYVSGACTPPSCPNTNPIFQHDFGSILAFTEHNFNLQFIDQVNKGYADYNALDSANGNLPLSDFFALWTNSNSAGRPFVQMPTNYPASFFQSYYATYGATPTGPDTD
jgi:Phosphoesterase family